MNRKPLVMAITLALGTPFLSLAAVAEQVKTAEFDEVLVSATRIQEKVSESSRSAAVVGEEQLAEKQAGRACADYGDLSVHYCSPVGHRLYADDRLRSVFFVDAPWVRRQYRKIFLDFSMI